MFPLIIRLSDAILHRHQTSFGVTVMFKYIHQTWTVGREFDFPVSFIIREIMRGLFTHVNAITEI